MPHSWFYILILIYLAHGVTAKNFKIGLLAPWSDEFEFSGFTSASAVSIAIDRIHSDPYLNANGLITLSMVHRDSMCLSKQAIGQAVDLWHNESINVFIGPPCSSACKSLAEIAAVLDLPVISWVATDPDLGDKERYTTLARTLGPFYKMGVFLLEHLKMYKWNRVAILSSNYLLYADASRAITKVFKENNVTIAYESKYDRFPPGGYIDRTLLKTKSEARVVLLISPSEDRRRFMIAAHDLGMTEGDYVFYTIDMLPDEEVLNPESVWKGNDGRDVESKIAFEAVFHVTLAALSGRRVTDFRMEVADRMKKPPWDKTIPPEYLRKNQFQQGDKYSPFLYDAVLLYAIALNETMRKGMNPNSGRDVAANMRNKLYGGMSGNVVLDELGDREPDYWIMDMDPTTGVFLKIAEVLNTENGGRVFRNDILEPNWPGGKRGHKYAPPDIPTCGFLGEKCKETKMAQWVIIMSAVAVCVILLTGSLATFFLYRKRKYEATLLVQSWRIDMSEIEMTNQPGGHSRQTLKSIGVKSMSSTSDSASVCGKGDEDDTSTLRSSSKGGTSMFASFATNAGQLFSEVGYYRGSMVALKHIKKEHIQLSRRVLIEFNEIKDISHENLNVFVGAGVDPPDICLIWHYCPRGSIQDILMNDDIKVDDSFKLSFMLDIAKGMEYIHKSHLISHGNLKSSNCLVDSRWMVRITDYGLSTFLSGQNFNEEENQTFKRKLYTAPEILRENFPPPKGTQKGDVFSFSIVCFEIVVRSEPYTFDDMTPRDVVNRIRNGESIPFRPKLPEVTELGPAVVKLIKTCWSEDQTSRPTFSHVRSTIRKVAGGDINIMENVMALMEKYAYNLEEIVDERTQQVVEEKKKTDAILYKMLPAAVADALKVGKPIQPETYDAATIYFSDIVGFTSIASDSSPMQIVDFLNDLYTCFDDIISRHDVYKVETIGDAYMVVSGVPTRNGGRHVQEIANVSLDLLSAVTSFKIRHRPQQQLRLRIGLHSGSVVAGVVGLMMPRYCLFGDTVNVAAKMESSGKPLRIHVSKQTYMGLKDSKGGYEMCQRGEINFKAKGLQMTYWMYGKAGYAKPLPAFDRAEMAAEDKRDFIK